MNIAKNLQRLMQQHNVTAERLAQDLFLPLETVNAWLDGSEEPTLEQLTLLRRCFSITLDELCAQAPTELSQSERYVIPDNSEDDIASITAYRKQLSRPALAGLITTVASLFFMQLLQVPTENILFPIFLFLYAFQLIQSIAIFNGTKNSIVKRNKGEWGVYTFTKDVLFFEKWNSEGMTKKGIYKKENLSLLSETDQRYDFMFGNQFFNIRKNLLSPDSLVHSFLAEKKAEKKKPLIFLKSLQNILIVLSALGIVLMSNIDNLLPHNPVAKILIIAMSFLMPVATFVVALLQKKKNRSSKVYIFFLIIFLILNILLLPIK